MGLIYDAGESSSVMSALAENLSTVTTVLSDLEKASARLISEVGTNDLSGKGYEAVKSLFAEAITPTIIGAKDEVDSIRKDLEKYTYEDSKVAPFGRLQEDELKAQLEALQTQQKSTETKIERNERYMTSAAAVPGVCEGMEVANRQLQLILAQLEGDIRDLEDRIRALQQFSASTTGLFATSRDDLLTRISDVINLLDDLNEPIEGSGILKNGEIALGAYAQRQKILDFLGQGKITVDAQGRLKANGRFLSKEGSGHLYSYGKHFNEATGTRVDYYKKYFKSGLDGAKDDLVGDYTGWKDAGRWAKAGKIVGIAGTGLDVAVNVNTYFGDGEVGKHDVADFAVDTGVDLATAAAAAGVGAAFGSAFVPPLGTVVGALAGLAASLILSPANDAAKKAIKDAYK